MSSTIKSLLDDYARCKQATLEARIKYNKAREEAMSFLRYENQTKERIEERFAKVAAEESRGYFNGDGTIPSSKRAHYYNAYLIPLTDTLYSFCNPAVFPLYYLYIEELTEHRPNRLRQALCMLPSEVLLSASWVSSSWTFAFKSRTVRS